MHSLQTSVWISRLFIFRLITKSWLVTPETINGLALLRWKHSHVFLWMFPAEYLIKILNNNNFLYRLNNCNLKYYFISTSLTGLLFSKHKSAAGTFSFLWFWLTACQYSRFLTLILPRVRSRSSQDVQASPPWLEWELCFWENKLWNWL